MDEKKPDDKKSIIVNALNEHSDWSDRKIAQSLGVSHPYVARVRKELGLEAGGRGDGAQVRKSYGAPALPTGYGQADMLTLIDLMCERMPTYYEDTTTSTPDPVVEAISRFVRSARNCGLYSEEEDQYFGMLESGTKWFCFNCEAPVLPGTSCSRCGASTKLYPPTERPQK